MTTKFNKSDFTEGDLVKINGESDDGSPEEWIGEVVDVDDPTGIVVCLLERTKEQESKIWRFTGAETIAPVESIKEHVVPERPDGVLTRRTVKNAWEAMGFSVGVDDFCLKEDESSVTLELGKVDTSSEEEDDDEDDEEDEDYDPGDACDGDEEVSSDEECDDPSLGGFIVADEEEEDDFVSETHNAVNDWEDWQPHNKRQRRFKRSVDALAQRAAREADDAAFSRGEAASVRPPKRRAS
jgi:hypothetical protein